MRKCIGFCGDCKKVFVTPIEDSAGAMAGAYATTEAHKKASPECHTPMDRLQILNGDIKDLPDWARKDAMKLLSSIHWSETPAGHDLWTEAFAISELSDVKPEDLKTGMYTNAQIAAGCATIQDLYSILMALPECDDMSARAILSFNVDQMA